MSSEVIIAEMQKDIQFIKLSLEKLEQYFTNSDKENKKIYVTQDQFRPVRLIVYSLTGLILTSVFLSILASILK